MKSFEVLPEGKERNYADRDQQLHEEDGVDLQEGGHAVRTALLMWRVVPVSVTLIPS